MINEHVDAEVYEAVDNPGIEGNVVIVYNKKEIRSERQT